MALQMWLQTKIYDGGVSGAITATETPATLTGLTFGFACACLGVDMQEHKRLAEEGWRSVNNDVKFKVQKTFSCCGFDNKEHNITDPMSHPECFPDSLCCETKGSVVAGEKCACPPCESKLQDTIEYAFKLCGGIGLFFCFTEFVGVWLTVRYRNQKDPRANPSAFL